jgi:uncharacterized membrane protein YdbT with pleckstrin-like domain
MNKNIFSNAFSFLLNDETLILRVNPHWLFLALPLAGISFFFLFYFVFACPFIGTMVSSFELSCYILIFLILFFFSLVLYLDWKFNRLYLTNLRLIQERGIIGKRRMSIRLENIQDITCEFGISGKIFNFGSLVIESAGKEGKMVFQGIPSPTVIKRMIENEVHKKDSSRSFPST